MGWHQIKRRQSDIQFSLFIRKRDGWKCQNPKCGRQLVEGAANLHCSHFWSRHHKSVRWDPENADAMCAMCHKYWESHRNEYKEWKFEQLGQKRYDALEHRKESYAKDDEKMARLYVVQLLKELEENGPDPDDPKYDDIPY